MGGTGGAMLTQLLIKAKNLDFSDIILSEHGHAHSNYQDFTICEFGVTYPDMHKIKHVLNSDVIGKYPPYFISLHLKDLELSKKYFNKSIRITYDNNDISDLAHIFVMKNSIDIQHLKNTLMPHKLNEREIFLKNNLSHFKQSQSDDALLFVTWEEIYNGNISKLINTLADFTGIPKINFNENLINNWRHVTKTSLAEIKNRI